MAVYYHRSSCFRFTVDPGLTVQSTLLIEALALCISTKQKFSIVYRCSIRSRLVSKAL